MKVYTKTGDRGQTSLVGGKRVSKCCSRLESYGNIDELNSEVGLLITYCKCQEDAEFLTDIQSKLFIVGGYLATDNSEHEIRSGNIVEPEMIAAIEQQIDAIDAILPPLKLFILPGGCRAAAICHVCRTMCRRAERCVLRLIKDGAEVDENVTAYINRLSDYFFVLARKLNFDENHPEIIWRRTK